MRSNILRSNKNNSLLWPAADYVYGLEQEVDKIEPDQADSKVSEPSYSEMKQHAPDNNVIEYFLEIWTVWEEKYMDKTIQNTENYYGYISMSRKITMFRNFHQEKR